MKSILSFALILSFHGSVFASEIDPEHDKAVRDGVEIDYSQGRGDDTFHFSKENDIWDLEYVDNEEGCIAFVKGRANKPSYRGPVRVEFWACVTEPEPGHFEAEIWDEQQVGD